MFEPWPRIINRIDGPRVWAHIDRRQISPALMIDQLSAERYRPTIEYLACLNELSSFVLNRYEAKLLDQVADMMIDLAFLNRHGTPDEGFVAPSHWGTHWMGHPAQGGGAGL